MDTVRKAPYWIVIALLVYMPFHIFLAQSLSLLTGGLEIWKVAKDALLFLAVILSLILVWWTGAYQKQRYYIWFLGLTIAYCLAHLLIWGLNSGINTNGAILGTVYNCRLLGYGLLAWSAVLVYPGKIEVQRVAKIIVVISSIVCALGILQYLLPKDILTHVGYSLERGVKPAFFIDDKTDLPRIMSTLRDPNSLGAYLILPITMLSLAWARMPKKRMLLSGVLLLHAWALFLTFSRSAWLGVALSVFLVLLWNYRSEATKFAKKYWPLLAAGLTVMILGVFLLRDQYVVQNVVFHADESTKLSDPNELRVSFFQKSVDTIADNPLGHGPGTAGIVSIRTEKVVLTENYFLQIAYEIGVAGLAMLVGILAFVIKLLLDIKNNYAKVLVASFAGITVSAMLLHTWTNEAVAATWWLLTGMVLAEMAYSKSRVFVAGENAPKVRRSA